MTSNEEGKFTFTTRKGNYKFLKNMMSLTQHTLQKEGMWLAMKSKDVKEELEEFEKNQYTLIPLEVPFINAERYLVILKKDNC